MEKYNLLIFPSAKQDLTDIVEYINTLSPSAAINQYDGMIEQIATLAHMPGRCPLLKNNELRAKGYRALVVDNYLVFYVIKDKTVQVRRILFGRRNYEFLLNT